jgi:uncharacterized protein (TIGR03435 family)
VDRIEAVGILMPQLIEVIADEVGRPVIDRTGVAGRVNVRLEFTPNTASAIDSTLTRDANGSPGLSLFTALQEQLGLRLESANAPVPVLVIERAERLTPN